MLKFRGDVEFIYLSYKSRSPLIERKIIITSFTIYEQLYSF